MTPREYVDRYKEFALETEAKTGFPAVAILAQSAVESGWGSKTPGNMFFGIKAGKGWPGKKQLLITTEYSSTKTPDYPVVLKAVEVEPGKYKCTVKDWFRAYDTPEGSFTDHANLIMTRPRYAKAVGVKSDWRRFVEEIAAAGYATAPDYAKTIIKVGEMVERYL